MEKWIAVAMVVGLSGCAQMAPSQKAACPSTCKKADAACPTTCTTEAPKAAAVCETPAVQESKAPDNRTLAEFIAAAKANAEKKGVEFNEKKATARFNKMDSNGDGIVVRAEQVAAQK